MRACVNRPLIYKICPRSIRIKSLHLKLIGSGNPHYLMYSAQPSMFMKTRPQCFRPDLIHMHTPSKSRHNVCKHKMNYVDMYSGHLFPRKQHRNSSQPLVDTFFTTPTQITSTTLGFSSTINVKTFEQLLMIEAWKSANNRDKLLQWSIITSPRSRGRCVWVDLSSR